MADDTDGSLRSRVRAVLTQRTVDTEVAVPGPHGPRAATAYAWWMLMIVPGVHQLESHVLQPLLMGSAVEVHPLAVVLAVAGGAMVAGIPGALFAVPLAAFVTVYITRRAWETDASVTDTDLIWTRVPRTRKGRA